MIGLLIFYWCIIAAATAAMNKTSATSSDVVTALELTDKHGASSAGLPPALTPQIS